MAVQPYKMIMQSKGNKQLNPVARSLRRNMTKEEKHLWYDFLHDYPIRFYRQKILGHYIADFYCAEAKLVIELDGSQHYESEGLKKDAERTAFLAQYDIEVFRIPNNEISRNFDGVCEAIKHKITEQITKLQTKPKL